MLTDRGGCIGGEPGYISYADIDWIWRLHSPVVRHDEVEAVQYFYYRDSQWVSYDGEETIRAKVEFANAEG